MTENEAKDWLKAISATQEQSIHKSSLLDRKEALYMAMSALEELQTYRAIGTVEECRVAVEKQRPKKPRLIGNAMICPSCPKVYSSDRVTCCINCGQKLDWE